MKIKLPDGKNKITSCYVLSIHVHPNNPTKTCLAIRSFKKIEIVHNGTHPQKDIFTHQNLLIF